MKRFRDPSSWTWWLMGGATVAVAAIWYLVDQKFQAPSTSFPNDPAAQKRLAEDAAEPNIDELLKAKQPLPSVDPLTQTLEKDAKPPTVTLKKPIDGLAAGPIENSTNTNKLPTPSRVSPLVLPSTSVSTTSSVVPSLRPQQPASPQKQPSLSTPVSPDRPGSLLPNLPDPMERFNSYSAPVQSEPVAPKQTQPIAEQKPAPAPAAPAKPEAPADTAEDSSNLPSQMPELFTSDPDKS